MKAARTLTLAFMALVAFGLMGCGASPPMADYPRSDVADESYASPGAAPMASQPPAADGAERKSYGSSARAPGRSVPSKAAARKRGSAKGKQLEPGQSKTGATGVEQMLVFTGQMSLVVAPQKFASTIDAAVDIAVATGGYISKQDDRSVTVRVPSKRFRDALREIGKLGQVTHRAIQAEDVTEQYHDLAVRLKSLRATRDRLQDFLKRAKTIAEVLQVERQLTRLNSQIDQIEGRMRFLATRAAFSTITVTLQPKSKKKVIVDPVNPPPPPPRTVPLPIKWLSSVGVDRLLKLR